MNKNIIFLLLCVSSITPAAMHVEVHYGLGEQGKEVNAVHTTTVNMGQRDEFTLDDVTFAMVISPEANEKIRGDFEIKKNGNVICKPCIISLLGRPAFLYIQENKKSVEERNFFKITFIAKAIE